MESLGQWTSEISDRLSVFISLRMEDGRPGFLI